MSTITIMFHRTEEHPMVSAHNRFMTCTRLSSWCADNRGRGRDPHWFTSTRHRWRLS